MKNKNKTSQTFFIMLGDACNFKCTYCMQGDHKLQTKQPTLSNKFLSFLDKNKNQNISLCFWGGEPLLYFPTIKKIVEKYKNEFYYETVSNGSLLTQEIVDFFNEHKIKFSLSHDSNITTVTRKTDVLKNKKIKNLFEQLQDRVVNVTYSSISPTMEDIFESYCQNEMISINTIINSTDTETSRMYADFDINKYKQDILYLLKSYEAYQNGDSSKWREYKNVISFISALGIYLEEGRDMNRCYDCAKGKKILNLDCDGNIFLCHNSKIKVGTVENNIKDIKNSIEIIIKKNREKCQSCDFQKVCGGNCVILSGYGEKQKCEISKIFYSLFIPWITEISKKNRDLI